MRIDKNPNGLVDDVVVENVKMFRLEMMDDDAAWIRLYLDDENSVAFNIYAYTAGIDAVLEIVETE